MKYFLNSIIKICTVKNNSKNMKLREEWKQVQFLNKIFFCFDHLCIQFISKFAKSICGFLKQRKFPLIAAQLDKDWKLFFKPFNTCFKNSGTLLPFFFFINPLINVFILMVNRVMFMCPRLHKHKLKKIFI